MIKVTSKKTITFPKFNWGIDRDAERELPEDKDAQKAILAHPAISEVGSKPKNETKEVETKKEGDDK